MKPPPACPHANASRLAIYEYCEDCGAVRRLAQPGESATDTAWHSCDHCRLLEAKA